MKFEVVELKKENDINLIIGQSHFIRTVEDIYAALKIHLPSSLFAVSFCEASGDRKIRTEGNDKAIMDISVDMAQKIASGHTFVVVIRQGYPISVLPAIKQLPEVCTIYAAGANDMKVIVAEDNGQRAVVGVFDGYPPLGNESTEEKRERRELLVRLGYKL